jgi:hypothetical protein
MNTNAPILMMISKICTSIALIFFLFMIISSLAMEDAGLFISFILSAFASFIALVSTVTLLIMGNERTGLLMLMLIANSLLVVLYICITLYVGFILPVAVNETLNGG